YTVLLRDRVLVRDPCARAAGDRHCGGSLCCNLNGGGIVDAGRHSRACRALSSSRPLVCRTDGTEGVGRWAITHHAALRLLRDRARAGRNQPAFGGSLCSSSGHRLSTTARTSSEMVPVMVSFRRLLWIRCNSAGSIILPAAIRGS